MQDESILFDPASKKFCLLNGTAAAVWERLATPATLQDLTTELRQRFDAPEPAQVEADVRRVLQRFTELSLVTAEADA